MGKTLAANAAQTTAAITAARSMMETAELRARARCLLKCAPALASLCRCFSLFLRAEAGLSLQGFGRGSAQIDSAFRTQVCTRYRYL
jgi:hypothetical protein